MKEAINRGIASAMPEIISDAQARTVRQKYSPPSAANLRGDNGYQLFLAGIHTVREAAASAGCSRMAIYRRLKKEQKS